MYMERQRLLQIQQERMQREAAFMASQHQASGNSASSLLQMLSGTNSDDAGSSSGQPPAS